VFSYCPFAHSCFQFPHLLIHTTMPDPTEFYSASEREAFAWICEQALSPSGVSINENTFLPSLEGRPLLTGGGKALDQPPSKRSPLPCVGENFVLFPDDTTPAQSDAVHKADDDDDDDLKDDDPALALAHFDAQYQKWSQAHNGTLAQDLPKDSAATSAPEATPPPSPLSPSAQDENAGPCKDENVSPSKIASLIAKAKAKLPNPSAGILTSQSASQRRAALKGKHRRPAIDTTPAPAPAPEPPKGKRLELMYDNSAAGRQRALGLAVKEGIIDPKNDEQVRALMKKFEESMNKKRFEGDAATMAALVEKGGAVLGVVREDE
jgi:hypothetical protein